jgi:hypothetical protein
MRSLSRSWQVLVQGQWQLVSTLLPTAGRRLGFSLPAGWAAMILPLNCLPCCYGERAQHLYAGATGKKLVILVAGGPLMAFLSLSLLRPLLGS